MMIKKTKTKQKEYKNLPVIQTDTPRRGRPPKVGEHTATSCKVPNELLCEFKKMKSLTGISITDAHILSMFWYVTATKDAREHYWEKVEELGYVLPPSENSLLKKELKDEKV
jgi:hypothetical protein